MAERLDGVDLRIGIPDADVASVIAALGLDTREPEERAVHLLEDLSGAPARLMAAGATARLQCAPGRCEVVVQLRPARRARLGPPWAGFRSGQGHRLRITEEWVATQRVLIAALTASLDRGELAAVPARAPVTAEPGSGLLSATQASFLADCAGLAVPGDRLMMIGPIRERVWTLRQDDLRFRVRRWTAHGRGGTRALDLADLEARTSPEDAPFLFPALRSLARQHLVDTEAEAGPLAIRALIWASATWRLTPRDEGFSGCPFRGAVETTPHGHGPTPATSGDNSPRSWADASYQRRQLPTVMGRRQLTNGGRPRP